MRAKKIYLRDTDQTIDLGGGGTGGAGTAINASIYFTSDTKDTGEIRHANKLLIRCNPGEIQEGDEVILGRNVNNVMRVNQVRIGRYHGWVIPRKAFPLTLSYVGEQGGMDIWSVVPRDYDSFVEYEGNRSTREDMSLMKKCGIAICRDGVRLTEWLHFRVVSSQDEELFLSRW